MKKALTVLSVLTILIAGADDLQQKFPNGPRPEIAKMGNVSPEPSVEQGAI